MKSRGTSGVARLRAAQERLIEGGMSAHLAGKCQWFARCCNPATTTVAHPMLGDVPCCARCADFATGGRS